VLVVGLVAVVNLGEAPEPQPGGSGSSSDHPGGDEGGAEGATTELGQQGNFPDGGSAPSDTDAAGSDGAPQPEPGGVDRGAGGRSSLSGGDDSSDDSRPGRRDESAKEERTRLRREAIERRRAREAKTRREPVEVDSGSPVRLSIVHNPIRSARMGSSELVTVRMDAPRSSRVVLHAGPAGGPYKKTRLKAKSGGRWEGWIDFRGTSVGEEFHYWLVASHPRASASDSAGSRSAPNRVEIE
jgi:hypothetical protein